MIICDHLAFITEDKDNVNESLSVFQNDCGDGAQKWAEQWRGRQRGRPGKARHEATGRRMGMDGRPRSQRSQCNYLPKIAVNCKMSSKL